MASKELPTFVSIRDTGPSRTLTQWAGWHNVRVYAGEHGAAGALRANGAYTIVYVDESSGRRRYRTKTFRHVIPTWEASND